MIESIKDLLQKEAQAVLNIPVTDAYEKAVDLIMATWVFCKRMICYYSFPTQVKHVKLWN